MLTGYSIFLVTSSTGSPTPAFTGGPSPSNHSKTGTIAGAVVGGVGALLIALAIAMFFFHRKRKKQKQTTTVENPQSLTRGADGFEGEVKDQYSEFQLRFPRQ